MGQQEYISAGEFGRRIGLKDMKIIDAIRRGDLPAFRKTNGRTSRWHILEEDAIKYSRRMGWNYVVKEVQSEVNGHAQISSPDLQEIEPVISHRCDSCGNTRGNILGDVNENTHERYGYLCARCSDLVRISKGDLTRMRNTLAYLERTRHLDKVT